MNENGIAIVICLVKKIISFLKQEFKTNVFCKAVIFLQISEAYSQKIKWCIIFQFLLLPF